jgi:hypothetical protein
MLVSWQKLSSILNKLQAIYDQPEAMDATKEQTNQVIATHEA